MIANALLAAFALELAYAFWLLGELQFLARYRAVLFEAYRFWIGGSGAVLFFNLFGIVLLLERKFLLKNAGRKLSHLDREFESGQLELQAPFGEERS